MRGVHETDVKRDLDYRFPARQQDLPCPVQSQASECKRGRHPSLLGKQPFKLATRQADRGRKLLDGDPTFEMLFHIDQRGHDAVVVDVVVQRLPRLDIELRPGLFDLQAFERVALGVPADVAPDQGGGKIGGTASPAQEPRLRSRLNSRSGRTS
ncbi:hypothetical protein SS05631_c31480 [Sinorhizobium sp. CCBAU 05631]|nr:hypothetical protein SS05631_c31480 [Sinorhizobium sp. CCBAU 05631]